MRTFNEIEIIICQVISITARLIVLRDMPTEVYYTRANTLPLQEVWMVNVLKVMCCQHVTLRH